MRVTCVAVSVFLCIFWGCGCVLGACLYRLSGAHKRHLEERRLAKVLAEQDDDEDNLRIDEDEEAMEDSEEVMMRTWQYRMKEFLASSRATFLILSVVFVDLIVVITSGFLTEYDIKASSTQQKHVDIFSYVVVLFFFFEIVLRIHVWRKVTGNYRAFCTDPLNIIDLLLVIIDVVLEITVLILLSYVEKYQSEEQVSERGGERERERERERAAQKNSPPPPLSVSLFHLDGAAERIRASDPRGAHAAAAAAYARGEGRARAAADHGRGARGPRGRRLGG